MSQTLVPMIPLLPSENTNMVISGVADITTVWQVFLKEFAVDSPVKIINNKLHVKENLLENDRIYSIMHKDQEYFIRRHKCATEIFQLSD